VIKRISYLEKYFDKQPESQTYKNLQRERGIQIVMVHGGVREVQPGYSESQIAIWSMLFLL
jgi:hypothetical protein